MFFIIILKQRIVKILIHAVKTRRCYSCFLVKISKSHNKNDKSFSSCRSKTSDGNTLKQYSQCMNTVLQNMNSHWKLLLQEITNSQANYLRGCSFATFSAKIHTASVNLY